MSQVSPDFVDKESRENGGQRSQVGVGMGMDYIPTEDEKRIFRECNQESFWYRSVPISVISMAVTQGLITRGALTSSTRFGSLPKVAFAGVCGYLLGKISYMKTCQEKFKSLENSPLGEALRQRQRHLPAQFHQDQSEFTDPNNATFDATHQLSDNRERPLRADGDLSFNQPLHNENAITSVAEVSYLDDEPPKKQSISYEDLRIKNRENYEVTLTKKAESLLQPSSEKPFLKKDGSAPGKKNMYGDVWDE